MEHEQSQDPTSSKQEDATEPLASHPSDEAKGNEIPSIPSLQDKYDELNDQHLRLAADFENFRKRVAQEREALLKYGAENTVQNLLPILDNLKRASNSLSEDSDPKMLYQSFDMLSKQLLDSLTGQGLKVIETTGQLFDPNFHEATNQIETTEHPENTIVHEIQSGFLLHERVIRPALVSVATPPAQETTPNSNEETANPFVHSQETELNSWALKTKTTMTS